MFDSRLIAPSFRNGFARSPGESAAPELWPTRAWLPALGIQGGVIYEIVNGEPCAITAGADRGSWITTPYGIGYDVPTGTSDYVTSGRSINTTKDLTALIDVTPNASSVALQAIGEGISTNWNFYIGQASSKWVASCVMTSGGAAAFTATEPVGTIADGQRAVIASVIRQGESIRLYVGGRQSATTAITKRTFRSTTGGTKLMLSVLSSFTYDGTVRAALIWDRALTASEIAELSRDPLLPFRLRKRAAGKAPAGGTVSDFTASSSISFASSASLVGTGNVSASSSIAFGANADLVGTGNMTATSSLSFGADATLLGTGNMTAGAGITFGADAALVGTGNMSASSSIEFGADATLLGTGNMSATSGIAFSTDAALAGTGNLSITTGIAFTATATFPVVVDFSASASIVFTAQCNLEDFALYSNALTLELSVGDLIVAELECGDRIARELSVGDLIVMES